MGWCGFELYGCGLRGCGIPAALPAPRAVLAGFKVLGLPVGDPFGATLEVSAEEVAHAVGVFEALYVNGEGREHLKNAV
jgi:hypothetical protein